MESIYKGAKCHSVIHGALMQPTASDKRADLPISPQRGFPLNRGCGLHATKGALMGPSNFLVAEAENKYAVYSRARHLPSI